MRSVHFVHSFSKLSETFIYDYVTSLEKQEVEVRVITFNHLNRRERPFESVSLLNLPWWNIARIRNILRDFLMGRDTETSSWPVYRKRLKKMLVKDSPDVLHAHFGPMGILLAPVAKDLGIPLVVTFYGYDISELVRQDFWKQAYKNLADIADRITVLSKEMKERALAIGFADDQVEIIHLGTKVDEITYRAPSYPIRRFLSIGRLSEKKGHLDTLKAFDDVSREVGSLHLTIIGEGEDRPMLETFIKSRNMQDRVSMPGNMPHSKVIEHLKRADAFILNSKTASDGDREGTPTVLIEAQAAGLPCISTLHAGIPEIIPPENHRFLAEEGNISQIKSNIRMLINASMDEIEDISRLGRKRVEKAFNINRETAKIKELYNELI